MLFHYALSCFIYSYAECHYTECRHAEFHYTECHYAEGHNAECCGTCGSTTFLVCLNRKKMSYYRFLRYSEPFIDI